MDGLTSAAAALGGDSADLQRRALLAKMVAWFGADARRLIPARFHSLFRRTTMLLFIPRSLCALKRVAAKSEHARFGATTGIRIALASGLYRAEARD